MEELLPFEKVKREIFIKKKFETNYDYGQDPEKRNVEELIDYGIINHGNSLVHSSSYHRIL